MTPCAQLVDELVGEDLGAAARERHLGAQDRDAHARLALLRGAEKRELGLSAATRASRSSIRRRAAALNDRWSYASGSTYQRISFLRTALTGVPIPAADAGTQAQRPVGRDGPEALGLRARSQPVVRPAGRARVGLDRRISSWSAANSASTSTSSADGNPLSAASSGTGEVYPPGLRSSEAPPPPACPRTTLVVIHHKRCQRCLDRNPRRCVEGTIRSPDYEIAGCGRAAAPDARPRDPGRRDLRARACRALARVGAHEYEAVVPTLAPDAGEWATTLRRDRMRLDVHARPTPRDGGRHGGPERSAGSSRAPTSSTTCSRSRCRPSTARPC